MPSILILFSIFQRDHPVDNSVGAANRQRLTLTVAESRQAAVRARSDWPSSFRPPRTRRRHSSQSASATIVACPRRAGNAQQIRRDRRSMLATDPTSVPGDSVSTFAISPGKWPQPALVRAHRAAAPNAPAARYRRSSAAAAAGRQAPARSAIRASGRPAAAVVPPPRTHASSSTSSSAGSARGCAASSTAPGGNWLGRSIGLSL